ncbi:Ldh family oxidoreductase [Schnuerera sp. xch1]|uniref:Ldh family oxidoreductase n=1 Tax=Schnuerera sp. xch1 TaxID=2874283 RepID=UPI001CBF75C4|nr:Ldh family oxidoreductase [Schnuerera sp. xch1]MBZ2174128.1 Ldh family oxidoreductase [Schnuerera sp. xch1]
MYYTNKKVEHKFVTDVFKHLGVREEDAKLAADVVVQSDVTGVNTHGLARMPMYVRRLQQKAVNPTPNIRQTNESENLIALDGDNGPGNVVGPTAINMCIEAAKKHGFAAVSIKNSNHYGVGNYYGWKFAEANLIGMTMTNSTPNVAPTGGSVSMIGTNPVTIAIPAGKHYPLVLDMATSVVAFGKIRKAAEEGKKIPLGWAVDKDGKPTEDPNEALNGSLLPIGGYKGYGLAMVIDILSAVLSQSAYGLDIGNKFDPDCTKPEKIGHFMLAIDISKFLDLNTFKKSMDEYIETMKNTEKAVGVEEIYIPGEIEFLRAEKIKETGIPVAEGIQAKMIKIAKDVGIGSDIKTIDELFDRYR